MNSTGDATDGDTLGQLDLIPAIAHGHYDLVKRLLESGVSPDTDCLRHPFLERTRQPGMAHREIGMDEKSDFRGNALCAAVDFNQRPILKLLLDYGANANAHGTDLYTPLYHATFYGKVDMANDLLLHGVDVNVDASGGGATAVENAIELESWDILQVLIDRGADLNIQSDGHSNALYSAVESASSPSEDDSKSLQILDLLLEKGADPTIQPLYRRGSLLHCAIEQASIAHVAKLCEKGALMHLGSLNEYGATPLCKAMYKYEHPVSIDMITFLLDHGASPDDADDDGNTPLSIAIRVQQSAELVSLMYPKSRLGLDCFSTNELRKCHFTNPDCAIELIGGDQRGIEFWPQFVSLDLVNSLCRFRHGKGMPVDLDLRLKTDRTKRLMCASSIDVQSGS